MSVRDFFETHIGKATGGVFLTGVVLFWPPVVTWVAACLLIAFSMHHFRQSFLTIDAEARAVELIAERETAINIAALCENHEPASLSRGEVAVAVLVGEDR